MNIKLELLVKWSVKYESVKMKYSSIVGGFRLCSKYLRLKSATVLLMTHEYFDDILVLLLLLSLQTFQLYEWNPAESIKQSISKYYEIPISFNEWKFKTGSNSLALVSKYSASLLVIAFWYGRIQSIRNGNVYEIIIVFPSTHMKRWRWMY